MSPESIFSVCSSFVLLGWITLIFAPFWFHSDKFIIGVIIAILAIVYTWLVATGFDADDFKKFSSLSGVQELFSNKRVMAAGWVHYLAFDLLVGVFIKRNSVLHNIRHIYIIPCLFLTFMLGPVGLLLYLIIRTFKTGNYFSVNFK